ncbi:hypothetical protein EHP00_1012 [Ecytonucleospora hepatopenaei]|uniref:Uncharacterized protein n=1 Tax=Ecytonucleospora hepatopenaei TaxID=646526 RepID=A0A1W0E658_9MICR|nr:hypothetical protein EHP00_1012 [Ecytonucleospora hepatopenaei]
MIYYNKHKVYASMFFVFKIVLCSQDNETDVVREPGNISVWAWAWVVICVPIVLLIVIPLLLFCTNESQESDEIIGQEEENINLNNYEIKDNEPY